MGAAEGAIMPTIITSPRLNPHLPLLRKRARYRSLRLPYLRSNHCQTLSPCRFPPAMASLRTEPPLPGFSQPYGNNPYMMPQYPAPGARVKMIVNR